MLDRCLCCLEKYAEMCKFYGEMDSKSIAPSNMLKIFPSVLDILQAPPNSVVCKNCFTLLVSAYNFYNRCIQTQLQLKASKQNGGEARKLEHNEEPTKKLPLLLPKNESAAYDCSKCYKSFEMASTLNGHFQENHWKASDRGKRIYKCKECSKKFTNRRDCIIHSVEHSNDNICHFCQNIFFNNELLRRHVEEYHQSAKYKCSMCVKTFNNKKQLTKHALTIHHVSKMSYFCSMCPYSNEYYDEIELQKHVHINHSDADSAPATVIDVIESTADELDMNVEFLDEFFLNEDQDSLEFIEGWDESEFSLPLDCDLNTKIKKEVITRTRHNEGFSCPRCNTSLQSSQELMVHLAREHNESTLCCSHCNCNFNNEDDLENHSLQHLHENVEGEEQATDSNVFLRTLGSQKFFECKNCGQSFLKKINFAKHACKNRQHNSKRAIKCPYCSEDFPSFQLMYLQTHKESQCFDCIHCNKQFKSSSGLRYHMKLHNSSQPLTCVYCEKKFVSNATLKSHMRTMHSNYRPYICVLCDHTFAFSDHLKKHVTSVHQNERNYLCSDCGKGFAQLSHLKQHSLIHSDANKTKCEHCNETFNKSSELKRHMAKKHEIIEPV